MSDSNRQFSAGPDGCPRQAYARTRQRLECGDWSTLPTAHRVRSKVSVSSSDIFVRANLQPLSNLQPRLSALRLWLCVLVFFAQASTLKAQPTTVIHGRVLDREGRQATNVWVQIQTLAPSAPEFARTGGWALASTNSDANGEFALSVAALPT